ncbi:methylaspartate mutase [Streptomyces sp. NPDC005494]|uniref:methylaspartate mutase n=1 Tax=Streptomyces sp. NPDC005494 TaxID=3364715 RepID=UPI00368BEF02
MPTGQPGRQSADFGAFVRAHGARGRLVVQPRMGFGDPARMRAGLLATRRADAHTVGTITLDSHTRVGHLQAVEEALRAGFDLNGYPVVSHPAETTERVLDGIRGPDFPVQVRHGSALPRDIFAAIAALGLTATEGGPVSYCLPYGRTPLAEAVREWTECSELFAELSGSGAEPHIETFGGCMLGQLCPPSQLVALSLLEAMFFVQHGVRSVSLSYAQQTHLGQDQEAVAALRRLCREHLRTDDWHVVVYAYMGVYPQTDGGALRLLGQAAELAVSTGCERLIVKTVAEARRIPTILENVQALEYAADVAERTPRPPAGPGPPAEADSQTYQEARALVEAVLSLHTDIGTALMRAFQHGYLDIPYCVHPDNCGRTRSYLDSGGRLRWADIGSLPLGHLVTGLRTGRVTAPGLLGDLSYVRSTFDSPGVPSVLLDGT